MAIGRMPRRSFRFLLAVVCLTSPLLMAHAAPPVPARGPETTLLVFAAASLTEALEEVDRAFSATTHIGVKTSYAASSLLAKQIEAGAHADVFFSADREWMDYLDTRGLLRAATRTDVLGNTLVLIAPLQSPVQLQIGAEFPAARGARRRAPRHGGSGLGAGGTVCARRAHALRRLGGGGTAPGARGKRACGARLRGARRRTPRDRVRDRCTGGKARTGGGGVSRR